MQKIRQCLFLSIFLIPFILNANHIDTNGPIFDNPPQDIFVECDNVPTAPIVTATSTCSGYVDVTFNESINPMACPSWYEVIRTWTATDTCMVSITHTQVVTVNDTQEPYLSGVLPDVIVSCNNIPDVVMPYASDNCDANASITFTEYNLPNGACPAIYDIVREWTATDNCGNQMTATRVITVEDVEAPILENVPGDMTVNCDAIPAAGTVTAIDCDPNVTITLTEDSDQGQGACFHTYSLSRTWTAIDVCGNVTTATQVIYVEDVDNPVFAFIPNNITLSCGDSIPLPATVTATDNCSATVVTFNETSTGTCPDPHLIIREWVATDECGNMLTASQVITIDSAGPPPCNMYANITIDSMYNGFPVSCAGATDGTISAYAQMGTPPYTHVWNTGDSIAYLLNVSAGYYEVTVTDAAGCMFIDSIYLNEPPAVFATANSLPASTPTAADGEVSVVATGGVTPYNFSWNNGATTDVVPNVPSGPYDVSVFDANGCFTAATTFVEVDSSNSCNNLVTTIVNFIEPTCFGNYDGLIMAMATGGVEPYTYNWSNGMTGQDIFNLPAGTYDVVVTDSIGCTATAYIDLFEPAPMYIYSGSTPASNATATDGTAASQASGGMGGFAYNWSNGMTGDTIVGLSTGWYSVTATDANGCMIIDSVEVAAGGGCNMYANITIDSMYNGFPVSCAGATDGTISAYAQMGTPPYTHVWNTGDSIAYLLNVSAGYYEVTVTDAVGCMFIDSIYLNEPSAVFATANSLPASTPTAADGEVSVVATGGVAPYNFSWNNGATTDVVPNVPSGPYDVSVFDANGCFTSATTFVEVDSSNTCNNLVTTIVNFIEPTCFGNYDGLIMAMATGGVEPYTYNWSNGMTGQDIFNLPAGTYDVVVTDSIGCTATAYIDLLEPAPIYINSGSTPASSPTTANGTAAVQATGGMGGFSYNWDNGMTGDTIVGLLPGWYVYTVIDNNGCLITDSVEVMIDQNCNGFYLNMSITTDYNGYPISCAGSNDGGTDAFAQGGTSPYTYVWNTGDSTSTLSNLPAGDYVITVTDAAGCVIIDSIFLMDPPAIIANTSSLPASSPTASDGQLDVVATGGAMPYTYYWNNGFTSPTVSGVPAGYYDVTVTDLYGCTAVSTVVVDFDTVSCNGFYAYTNILQEILCEGDLGMVEAMANGGPAPYTYNWTTGDTSQLVYGLPQGAYEVTVTAANGCTATNVVDLINVSPLIGYTGSWPTTTLQSSDGMAASQPYGGMPPYTYNWDNGAVSDSLFGLPMGQYFVTVTDANGCTVSDMVEVLGPDCSSLTATTNIIQEISCAGDADGIIEAIATGGFPPYNYNWNNGMSTPMLTNVYAGFYEVVITDSIGCSVIHSVYMMEPTPVHVLVNTIPESANGQADGAAFAIGVGGTSPYGFYWDGATGDSLTNLTAGQYPVTVVDAAGCIDTAVAIVGSNDPGCLLTVTTVVTSDYNGYPISCNDATDGSVTAMAGSGTAPYTFNWDNGATTATATNIGMGTYNVTVTDANGCTAWSEVTLAPPSSVVGIVQTAGQTSAGVNDGIAVVTASGGTGNYTYLWDDPSSSTTNAAVGLAPGVYMVTVTDDNGCMFITTCIVDAIDPDTDGDGFVNSVDNCPTMFNPGQEDSNNDGTGDVCTCDENVAPLVNTPGIHQSAYASLSADSVWTNYCTEGGELLLSLALDGTGAVIPQTEVRLEVGTETVSYYGDSIGFVVNGVGGVFLNRNWDVQPDVQPTSNVGVRYYFHQSDFDELNNVLAGNNASLIPSVTDMQFFKVTNPALGIFPPLPTIPQGDLKLISNGTTPGLNRWAHGSHGPVDHYAQYEVSSFSGGGGGGAEGGGALPVDLIYFNGQLDGRDALLKWGTASEENNLGFEIQRFQSDNQWKTIGFVAGQGTTAEVNTYDFRDLSIGVGSNYYRLKQVDVDGQFEHSQVVVVELGKIDTNVMVYPNPALDKISVVDVLLGKVKIYDAYGNLVKNLVIDQPTQTIDISNLKDGMYFMEVDEGSSKRKTSRFYKSSTN